MLIVQHVHPFFFHDIFFIFAGGKWVANRLNFTKQCRKTAYFRDKSATVSIWLDRSGLMSVIRNLSRLIWYVPKYLRLFVETYPQILWQKYLDTFCYPYRCLNLARPRKKFNFFIRFYYYSDSNIKDKFCEDPPSSQPCPFFLQRTGQRLF